MGIELAKQKPLGGKAYGSTPHLPNSRVGPGDWHIHEGQARILTEKARDRHDRIIVTEKLDGTCVTIAKVGGEIIPITRAGYHARTSPFAMHHMFADWVRERECVFLGALSDGQRMAGEWLAQAHGTRYAIDDEDELFVAFAVIDGKQRLPHDEARAIMNRAGVRGAHVIRYGSPVSVDEVMEALGPSGFHRALDPVEGAVWVCERNGVFDFIAKFVKSDKADGKFLPGCGGNPQDMPPVWNFSFKSAAA